MHNLKSGQALIMLVLIIALLMTIVAATSFRLTTEVQSSKLQAESVRALAAADAGIEVGLQLAANTANIAPSQFAFEDVSINIPGIDVNRSKVIITPDSDTVFTSHQISKDEQLTFYLKEYPNYPGDYDGRLTVLFGSKAGDVCGSDLGGRTTPAIEVTYLTGVAPNEVKREIIEPCGRPGTFRIGGTGHVSATAISTIIDNVTYNYQATISGFSGYEVLFMRSLFATTRMVIQGSASFPRQGKWIQSEAYSLSGPSKIVKVFQSLPQVPADFVVTTF